MIYEIKINGKVHNSLALKYNNETEKQSIQESNLILTKVIL